MPRYCIREDVVMYGTAYYYVCAADEDHARELYNDGQADYSDTDWGDTDTTGEYEVEAEDGGCDGCDREDTEDCPDYEEEEEEDEDEDGRKCADCVHHTGDGTSGKCEENLYMSDSWAKQCRRYEEADEDLGVCATCRHHGDHECLYPNKFGSWTYPCEYSCGVYEARRQPAPKPTPMPPVEEDPLAFLD